MSEIKVTNQNYEKEVMKSKIPVLLDFWADWCGPCKMLAPIISDIAKEYDGRIKVGKVDVDHDSNLATKHQIASIPTLLLFQNGKIINKSVGFLSREDVKKFIEQVL